MTRLCDAHCFAMSTDQASPARIRVSSVANECTCRNGRTLGGRVTALMACSAMKVASPSPAPVSLGLPIHRVAPASSAMAISEVAASKLRRANCMTRLLDVMPKYATCAHARFVRPRCWISTAFGAPVDPDVYITYARFSGLTPLPTSERGCRATSSRSVSMRTTCDHRAGRDSAVACWASMTATPASSRINAKRSSG